MTSMATTMSTIYVCIDVYISYICTDYHMCNTGYMYVCMNIYRIYI